MLRFADGCTEIAQHTIIPQQKIPEMEEVRCIIWPWPSLLVEYGEPSPLMAISESNTTDCPATIQCATVERNENKIKLQLP